MKKVKMSNKKFQIILSVVIAVVLLLDVVATIAMNYFTPTMDMFFGKAPLTLRNPSGTQNWMLDYYGEDELGDLSAAKKEGLAVAKKISDEGIILLKNKDHALPLRASDTVTPFGRSFVDPIYGGSGSGATDTNGDVLVTPYKAFAGTFANFNETMYAALEKALDSGNYVRGAIQGQTSTFEIGEFPISAYSGAESSIANYNDVGLLIISRIAGEGNDLTKDMSQWGGNPGEHMLELNDAEKAQLELAKESCDKVVVVINAATTFELGALELDDGVDAILWMGFPGEVGFSSLADILVGNVNPSGHTVDTFPADFTCNPVWNNLGDYSYDSENMDGKTTGMAQGTPLALMGSGEYLEYEEGIYMGYRYYETAALELGEEWYTAWKDNFDEDSYTTPGTGVVYPFGYGLSYTTFTQQLISHKVKDGQVIVEVNVTNTGDVAGKEVVEVYYSAPYTPGGIEKAHVVLAAFDKTDMLEPGKSQTLELSFRVEDMASYDVYGEGCYVLDAGTYQIQLMKNAHDVIDTFTYTQRQKIVYNETNPRQSEVDAQSLMNADGTLDNVPAKSLSDENAGYVAATNQFEKVNAYMLSADVTNMSRADFVGTFPTEPPAERKATDEFAAQWDRFDYKTDPELGNVEGSKVYHVEAPAQGEENGITVADMRGRNYHDPLWEDFLDQITYDAETFKGIVGGTYITAAIPYLGLPATTAKDGPVGATGVYGTGQVIDATSWGSTCVLAATFNTDLAYEMGTCVGNELLTIGVTGWYAPGLNIHRTPFSGRNFEYYSEDPLLSGKMAAKEVSGAAGRGINVHLKHFALNDEEVNRYKQTAVFANEQTMREIYLRGFEICVKEATCTVKYIVDDHGTMGSTVQRAAKGMMTSHFRIGTDHTNENYALLTAVLRDEWGFTGFVITDMMDGVNYDRRMRAGLDISMDLNQTPPQEDLSSPTAQWAFRKSIHNICYSLANSNALNYAAPGATTEYPLSGWQIGLIVANIVVAIFLALSVCWMILRSKDVKRHPERYAGTPEGDAIKAQIVVDPAVKRRNTIILIVIFAILAIAAFFGIRALIEWIKVISI